MTEMELISKEKELDIREKELFAYAREIQERERKVKEREDTLNQSGEIDKIFDLVNASQRREPEKKSPKGLSLKLIW